MKEGSVYIILEKSNLTGGMVNRSINRDASQVTTYRVTKQFWWIFSYNTEFVILEVLTDVVFSTNVFDEYRWYNREEILKKLDEFVLSESL